MALLGKISPAAANTDVLLYSVPAGRQTVANVNLCNRGASAVKARLAVVANADLGISAVTVPNKGIGCTSIPTLTVVGANTTPAQLTVASMSLVGAAVNVAGSGYLVGDVLTLTVAGSTASQQATVTVATISGSGGITGLTVSGGGVFTALGSGTATCTGGTGTGATFNTLTFGINAVTVLNSGNGYASAPSVTQSVGSGAVFTLQMAQTVEAADYIEYDASITANGVLERTGIALAEGESLFVRTDVTTLNAALWGYQELA